MSLRQLAGLPSALASTTHFHRRSDSNLSPFQNFSIEPGVGVAYHNISNAPGLDDRQQWAFDSLSLEFRYRVLDREQAPFGLTLAPIPIGAGSTISAARRLIDTASTFW